MTISDEQKSALTAKLNPDHVRKPTGRFGPKGDYIEGWHAIAEANRIFGFDGWSYDIVDMKECHQPTKNEKGNFGVSFTARVRVHALGVTREDIGYGSGFAGQIGDAYESATKEAVTDALKRALRSFGNPFGLALYDKSRENVGVDDPPFQPQAAAERIKARFEKAGDAHALKAAWNEEYDNVKRIGEADRALGEAVYSTYTTRKNSFEQKVAA